MPAGGHVALFGPPVVVAAGPPAECKDGVCRPGGRAVVSLLGVLSPAAD